MSGSAAPRSKGPIDEAGHSSKSWKQLARDRYKHSAAGLASHGAMKKGGGGKAAAGRLGDEAALLQLDPHDPNYDQAEVDALRLPAGHWAPSGERQSEFSALVAAYGKFASHVDAMIQEYLDSALDACHAGLRASQSLKDLDMERFHAETVSLIVQWDLRNQATPAERSKLIRLIRSLHDTNGCQLTPGQIDLGLRKLYNDLDELLEKYDTARTTLHEYATQLEQQGLTENVWADEIGELEQRAALLKDAATDHQLRARFSGMLEAYVATGDLDKLAAEIHQLQRPELHFELVKMAIQLGLERGNKEAERVSEMLAAYTGQIISHEAAQTGFLMLLEETEELCAQYNDVLTVLSCFIARAIADHVIPVRILTQTDITDRALASHVALQARHLLQGKGAAAKLQKVWQGDVAAAPPMTRKVSADSGTASPARATRRASASDATRRDSATSSPKSFVIGAKKPGTAAYDIEQRRKSVEAAKNAPPPAQKALTEQEQHDLAEKERLNSFGYYDERSSRTNSMARRF